MRFRRHRLQKAVLPAVEIVVSSCTPTPRRAAAPSSASNAAASLFSCNTGRGSVASLADQLASGLQGGAGIGEQGKVGGDRGHLCHLVVA